MIRDEWTVSWCQVLSKEEHYSFVIYAINKKVFIIVYFVSVELKIDIFFHHNKTCTMLLLKSLSGCVSFH